MADRKKFYIAKIDEDNYENSSDAKKQEEPKFKSEQFVSSVSGYRVKNSNDVPYVRYGNKGYQYEGLKDKEDRSEEYNRNMSATNQTRDVNRVPSYLQRPDYDNRSKVANYPDNEREFIPGINKNARVEEEYLEEDYSDEYSQNEFEDDLKNHYDLENHYEYETQNEYENDFDSENQYDYETQNETQNENQNDLKNHYDLDSSSSIDSNDDYSSSYESTETFGSSDDYFERVKKFNPSAFRINQEESSVQKEEVKPVYNDYRHIPESRPVYSTPDYGFQNDSIDEFKDIELEFLGNSKIQDTSFNSSASKSVSNTYEIKDTRLQSAPKRKITKYVAPKRSYLQVSKNNREKDFSGVQKQKQIIDDTLREFGIDGSVVNFDKGPSVTRFEIKLGSGVKVDKVIGIKNNLKMNLSAKAFRLEAPIRGKNTIGVEVNNSESELIYFGDLLTDEFLNDKKPVNVILGVDVTGKAQYLDISKMPHGLICGTSGSGKSVCINNIIMSILYKSSPEDVRLILVDPKRIEFALYKDIPHLITPIITDSKYAIQALKWCCDEMYRRYQLFEGIGRNLNEYNEYVLDHPNLEKLPYIVLIIDEFNDLMITDKNNVEDSIKTLAAMARAAGIHLIIGTQRPTADVVSGTIKANINARLAFKVKTNLDSRTILDRVGAEELLGNGDMIYSDGTNETRLQGPFISSKEIVNAVSDIKARYQANYMFSQEDLMKSAEKEDLGSEDVCYDDYFKEIARWVVNNNSASINRITKTFNVGFNRAQAIMGELENRGIVSESLGTKPRTVLVDSVELEEILERI